MTYMYSLRVPGKELISDATEGEVIQVITEESGMTWAEFMALETPLGNTYGDPDPTDLEEWTEYLLRYMPRIILGRFASMAFNVKFYEVFMTREKKR